MAKPAQTIPRTRAAKLRGVPGNQNKLKHSFLSRLIAWLRKEVLNLLMDISTLEQPTELTFTNSTVEKYSPGKPNCRGEIQSVLLSALHVC